VPPLRPIIGVPIIGLLSGLLILCLCDAFAPSRAEPAAAPIETTREDCTRAVAEARALAVTLPADDLSRYFAERHLQQALTEAGNGEFDDCLEWAARASDEARNPRHQLPPGESLKILRPDE